MMSPVVNEALCATLLSDLEGMRKGSSAFVLTYAGLVLFLHAQLGTQIGTRSIVYAHKHTHTHTHTRLNPHRTSRRFRCGTRCQGLRGEPRGRQLRGLLQPRTL